MKRAAWRCRELSDDVRGGFELIERLPGRCKIKLTSLGQRHAPCGSLEQSSTENRLKPAYLPTQGRRIDPQIGGRSCETSSLHDPHEGTDKIQPYLQFMPQMQE